MPKLVSPSLVPTALPCINLHGLQTCFVVSGRTGYGVVSLGHQNRHTAHIFNKSKFSQTENRYICKNMALNDCDFPIFSENK